MKQHRTIKSLLLALVIMFWIDGAVATAGEWYQQVRDLYYGLPVQVQYFPENPRLTEQVWAYLESINDVFNDYRPGSEISLINSLNETADFTMSPMLTSAFEKAQKVWSLSDGMFDVSCAPIRNLWKQGSRQNALPSDAEVAEALARCGLQNIALEGDRLSIAKAGMEFDFGGIVKGMIADHVIAMLKDGGAESALIQIGGETATFGLSQKHQPFRIAIQHPQFRDGVWCVIQDSGNGLSASTSGNYENPIIIDGEVFYHIMNPRTGRPAKTQIASVSIAFPQTGLNWMADSFSTAGVLLGPEKTFAVIAPFGGEAMFLIHEKGTIREVSSPGWGKFK